MAKAGATDVNIIDALREAFDRRDWVPYSSGDIVLTDHHLFCGAVAERAGAAPSLVAALLFHDIGHYGDLREIRESAEKEEGSGHALDPNLDSRHSQLGAQILKPFFGPEVTEPIRLHADAKRYLCTVEPSYLDTLGPQRVYTMVLQGGKMSSDEVTAFEAEPHFEAAVALRRFEDEGSLPEGEPLPDFEHFRPILEGLLKN